MLESIKITENIKKVTYSLKRELSLQFKRIKSFRHKVSFNVGIQKIYDANLDNLAEFEMLMQQYNINSKGDIYFATGVSGYFNDQVDNLGLANIRITGEDLEDVRFIQECFGNTIKYGENGVKATYTTLPGTTEVTYGMQAFPAGIYEDVFRFSVSHTFKIDPIVGESEVDYYCRNLAKAIEEYEGFPIEKKEEVLKRARKIATKFCSNKNRVYLIPISNILNNKISYGDEPGLRDGKLKGEELQAKLDSMETFKERAEIAVRYSEDNLKNNRMMLAYEFYSDPNYSIGEVGIAIYGDFSNRGITYFEVERKYELLQRKAKAQGYSDGDPIPEELLYTPINPQKK